MNPRYSYEFPVCEILRLEAEDVVTASGVSGGSGGSGGSGSGGSWGWVGGWRP